MPAEIDVGQVVAGKYELVRLIGKGAMGEVWLATHKSLGGEFAIKLVQLGEIADAAARFQLEARVSAKLSRKTRHIVSVSDHGEESGLAYLVMELLEGESLSERIDRVGELALPETVAIVMQVARALGQAHAEGILHRDLKPANLFLTNDEDGRLLVKLLDFGIARTQKPLRTGTPFTTGKDIVLGTPSYMSPEQARGLDSLDHRCDLWALCVVAYEALAARTPWEGVTLEDIFLSICTHQVTPIWNHRPELPPALEFVFARAFAPALENRFQTAAQVSDAFEALVDRRLVDAAVGTSARTVGSNSNHPSVSERARERARATHRGRLAAASDPMGVAVGEPSRRKRSAGWLYAALAAIAVIAIIVFAVKTFGARDRATATTPPSDPTAMTPKVGESTDGIPPPVPTPVVTVSATPLANPIAQPTGRGPRARPGVDRSPPSPRPVIEPPPTPRATAMPATTTTPPIATPPRKPVDKSEIF